MRSGFDLDGTHSRRTGFSIPFRYLWNTRFNGDLEVSSDRPNGLARFVGDDNNQILKIFADATADSFENLMGHPIWPIVLSGSTGTGKTSLALTMIAKISEHFDVQSTTRSTTQNKPSEIGSEKPIALSAVDFARRYQAALETDTLADFRHRLIHCPGVVIDDLHQLANRSAVQSELSLLIDNMTQRQRPLIVTTNQNPQQISGLTPQLVSRLNSGLNLPLETPGPDGRRIIIHDLCKIHRLELTTDAIDLLVNQLDVAVPKMVHFFSQLLTNIRSLDNQSDLPQPVDRLFLTRMFNRSDDDLERFSKTIIRRVAVEFCVKPRDMASVSRKQSIVTARGVAIYLIRKLLGTSFGKIGRLFGNRDHSTIMHAFRKTENIVTESTKNKAVVNYKPQIEKLEHELTNQFTGEISLLGKLV